MTLSFNTLVKLIVGSREFNTPSITPIPLINIVTLWFKIKLFSCNILNIEVINFLVSISSRPIFENSSKIFLISVTNFA